MTTSQPVREGFTTVTPYLAVVGAADLLKFAETVLGAEQTTEPHRDEDGRLRHTEFRIGDSMLMLGDPGDKSRSFPASLHIYVPDVDQVYANALEAGAVSLDAPGDRDYGDRDCALQDPSGTHWYIGTHRGSSHRPDGFRTVTPYLHPKNAGGLMDFLKVALHAEELARHHRPDGAVVHGQLRIGTDAIVEFGEASERYPSMPMMFYVYIEDVDGSYRRALDAGAANLEEPADQPYGERRAGVTDPAGNQWYFGRPVR